MQSLKEEDVRLKFIRQKIIKEISEQVDEVIPFDRFMDIALYSEKFGYYEKLEDIFGKMVISQLLLRWVACLLDVFKMKLKMFFNK